MKTTTLLIILLAMGWIAGCEDTGGVRNTLLIDNQAEHPVDFYVAASGMEHLYPDTSLPTSPVAMRRIAAGEKGKWSTGLAWSEFFGQLPADTLSIYLFHPDTLAGNPWATIRNQYRVLKRYDVSWEDLQKAAYTVRYP